MKFNITQRETVKKCANQGLETSDLSRISNIGYGRLHSSKHRSTTTGPYVSLTCDSLCHNGFVGGLPYHWTSEYLYSPHTDIFFFFFNFYGPSRNESMAFFIGPNPTQTSVRGLRTCPDVRPSFVWAEEQTRWAARSSLIELEETRAAIMEGTQLSELYVDRETGKVLWECIWAVWYGVLPGCASFVDIGLDRAAFLYAGDIYPEFASKQTRTKAPTEDLEHTVAEAVRRNHQSGSSSIQDLIKEGRKYFQMPRSSGPKALELPPISHFQGGIWCSCRQSIMSVSHAELIETESERSFETSSRRIAPKAAASSSEPFVQANRSPHSSRTSITWSILGTASKPIMPNRKRHR